MRRALPLVGLLVSVTGCAYTAPNPGWECVLVAKPAFFGTGGARRASSFSLASRSLSAVA